MKSEFQHARRAERGQRKRRHPQIMWRDTSSGIEILVDTEAPLVTGKNMRYAYARIPIAQLRAFIERHDRGA